MRLAEKIVLWVAWALGVTTITLKADIVPDRLIYRVIRHRRDVARRTRGVEMFRTTNLDIARAELEKSYGRTKEWHVIEACFIVESCGVPAELPLASPDRPSDQAVRKAADAPDGEAR